MLRFSSEQFNLPDSDFAAMTCRRRTFNGPSTKRANPRPKDCPTRPAHLPMLPTLRTTRRKSSEIGQGSLLCRWKEEVGEDPLKKSYNIASSEDLHRIRIACDVGEEEVQVSEGRDRRLI